VGRGDSLERGGGGGWTRGEVGSFERCSARGGFLKKGPCWGKRGRFTSRSTELISGSKKKKFQLAMAGGGEPKKGGKNLRKKVSRGEENKSKRAVHKQPFGELPLLCQKKKISLWGGGVSRKTLPTKILFQQKVGKFSEGYQLRMPLHRASSQGNSLEKGGGHSAGKVVSPIHCASTGRGGKNIGGEKRRRKRKRLFRVCHHQGGKGEIGGGGGRVCDGTTGKQRGGKGGFKGGLKRGGNGRKGPLQGKKAEEGGVMG